MRALSKAIVLAVAFLALGAAAPAHASQDSADQMCLQASGTWVYRPDKPRSFTENNKTYYNLYGTYCADVTGGVVAATGHCIASRRCLATRCAGEACKTSDVKVDTSQNKPSEPSLSDTGDVSGNTQQSQPVQSDSSASQQPQFTGSGDTLPAPDRSIFDNALRGTQESGGFDQPSQAPSSEQFSQWLSEAGMQNPGVPQTVGQQLEQWGVSAPQSADPTFNQIQGLSPSSQQIIGPDGQPTGETVTVQSSQATGFSYSDSLSDQDQGDSGSDEPASAFDACGEEGSYISCMRALTGAGDELEEARISRNNPGNMMTFNKGGRYPTSFSSLEEGARADLANIEKWISRGKNTVATLMETLSPSYENKTGAMIDFIAKEAGVSPNEKISFADQETILAIQDAKTFLEHSEWLSERLDENTMKNLYNSVAASRGITPITSQSEDSGVMNIPAEPGYASPPATAPGLDIQAEPGYASPATPAPGVDLPAEPGYASPPAAAPGLDVPTEPGYVYSPPGLDIPTEPPAEQVGVLAQTWNTVAGTWSAAKDIVASWFSGEPTAFPDTAGNVPVGGNSQYAPPADIDIPTEPGYASSPSPSPGIDIPAEPGYASPPAAAPGLDVPTEPGYAYSPPGLDIPVEPPAEQAGFLAQTWEGVKSAASDINDWFTGALAGRGQAELSMESPEVAARGEVAQTVGNAGSTIGDAVSGEMKSMGRAYDILTSGTFGTQEPSMPADIGQTAPPSIDDTGGLGQQPSGTTGDVPAAPPSTQLTYNEGDSYYNDTPANQQKYAWYDPRGWFSGEPTAFPDTAGNVPVGGDSQYAPPADIDIPAEPPAPQAGFLAQTWEGVKDTAAGAWDATRDTVAGWFSGTNLTGSELGTMAGLEPLQGTPDIAADAPSTQASAQDVGTQADASTQPTQPTQSQLTYNPDDSYYNDVPANQQPVSSTDGEPDAVAKRDDLTISSKSCDGGLCGSGNTDAPGDNTIKNLQRFLNEKGYVAGNVDGVYGRQTEAAVREFQKDQKIAADGIVGAETLGKMNKIIAAENAAAQEAAYGNAPVASIPQSQSTLVGEDVPLPKPRPAEADQQKQTEAQPQQPTQAATEQPQQTPLQKQAQQVQNAIDRAQTAYRRFIANPTEQTMQTLISAAQKAQTAGARFEDAAVQNVAAQLGKIQQAAGYSPSVVAGYLAGYEAQIVSSVQRVRATLNKYLQR